MSEEFDVQLLETKKKKFIEVVNRICENRNLPAPYVNFDGCPEENEDQLAHYHPDVNMICISKRQLTVLNFDDLEEVAAHEVAHILEPNHNSNFRNEENTNKMFAWKPSGVVIIDGNQPVDDSTKEAMEKTEEGLKRLQEQIEIENEEEIRRNFPLAPNPEWLVFSIRRERWKSDIKALGVGVGAGFVLMVAGSMFNVSSFIGLLGACIVAGVLSWKGRRIKNVVFAGVIMFMVMMCI